MIHRFIYDDAFADIAQSLSTASSPNAGDVMLPISVFVLILFIVLIIAVASTFLVVKRYYSNREDNVESMNML